MKCEYCEIADLQSKAEIIYEDDEVIAAIKDVVATPGQITVFPKEHFTILEMVPNKIVKKCADIANKIGIAVFESLGAQGTNIIIQNGLAAGQSVPHFAIEIIPRREGDGINLQWQPQQIPEDEMERAFFEIKEEGDKIKNFDDKEVKENEIAVDDGDTKMVMKKNKSDKDNYLLKSLKKIP
jgi:histidine triad (HIT) family protein